MASVSTETGAMIVSAVAVIVIMSHVTVVGVIITIFFVFAQMRFAG